MRFSVRNCGREAGWAGGQDKRISLAGAALAGALARTADRLKALAVTSATRSPATHQIATVAESGLPGYQVMAWNGLPACAGTPQSVLARISQKLKKVMQLPQVREKFAAQGFAAPWDTPGQFADFLRNEVDKWTKTVKASGATLN